MVNPFDSAVGWLHEHRPENPGKYVMPYMVVVLTLLLAVNLWQVAEARSENKDNRALVEQTREQATKLKRLAISNRRLVHSLRAGLIEACRKNGNTVRAILRGKIREEMEQANPALVRQFFPQIPPGKLEQILRASREDDLRAIHALRPVECGKQYAAGGKPGRVDSNP